MLIAVKFCWSNVRVRNLEKYFTSFGGGLAFVGYCVVACIMSGLLHVLLSMSP